MPLITLTCSKDYYPPESELVSLNYLDRRQRLVMELALILPGKIVENTSALHLDPDTPSTAVQVDIKQFHPNAVNAVDIWVRVEFTEMHDEVVRTQITDRLINILVPKFGRSEKEFSWALDVFFGPGHGCITDDKGKIVQSW